MRSMIQVSIPVDAGNRAIQDGSIGEMFGAFRETYKPEAMYMFADDKGQRSMLAVFDLSDPSLIPVIAEPFFMRLNAAVTVRPVMNADDLKAGMEKMSGGS